MANAKKSSSSKKAATKKVVKKIEEEKVLDLDEDLDDEVVEDIDFDLDDDDDDLDEVKELEVLSTDERLIRVEKKTKVLLVLQIVGLLLVLITLIVSISYSKGDSKKSESSNSETEQSGDYTYSTTAFKELTFGDISSLSKNKTIIVFMGRQGCYWCSLYAPIIGLEAQDHNFDVYYLDFGKIIDFSSSPAQISDQTAYEGLISWLQSSDYKDTVSDGIGTPMTFFVKNNKITSLINGYTDQNNLETILKQEGFIK